MFRQPVALSLVTLVLSAAGCSSSSAPPTTGTVPEQLEALEVALSAGDPGPASLAGTATVQGSERQYELSIATAQGAVAIDVHTPGASPLAALDGASLSVDVTEPGFGGRSLVASDDSGPVYVAAFGDPSGLSAAEAELGKGFVRFGDEVASESDGTFVWSYKKAVFATDEGDVVVLPGEVKTLKLDGATWRAVVIASYEVGTDPDAQDLPGCSPESMLGFELLRVAEAPAAEPPVRRLSGAQVAYAGCTAPGGE